MLLTGGEIWGKMVVHAFTVESDSLESTHLRHKDLNTFSCEVKNAINHHNQSVWFDCGGVEREEIIALLSFRLSTSLSLRLLDSDNSLDLD